MFAPIPRPNVVYASAIVVGGIVGAIATAVPIWLNFEYGFISFIGAPFLQGLVSAFISYRYFRPAMDAACYAALLGMLVHALILLVTAIEGLVCMIMAWAMWIPIVLLGYLAGVAIARLNYRGISIVVCVAPVVAVGVAAHDLEPYDPPLRSASTTIEIDAPPSKVWPLLHNLNDLPEPSEWFFRMGVAAPLGGYSRGALRVCNMTTGPIVETITVSKPNEELRWRVDKMPPTMREWNPFGEPQPSHLHNTFVILEGQYRIERLSNNRTRLTGTTWYKNRTQPEGYWDSWCKTIIGALQRRVMAHIKSEAVRTSL